MVHKLNLPWFRHSSRLSMESSGIAKLLDISKDMYANYILILELMCQHYTGSPKVSIPRGLFCSYLRIRNVTHNIENILKTISKCFEDKLKYSLNELEVNLELCKLLEIIGEFKPQDIDPNPNPNPNPNQLVRKVSSQKLLSLENKEKQSNILKYDTNIKDWVGVKELLIENNLDYKKWATNSSIKKVLTDIELSGFRDKNGIPIENMDNYFMKALRGIIKEVELD